jgi:hypothetical protein
VEPELSSDCFVAAAALHTSPVCATDADRATRAEPFAPIRPADI